MSTCSVAELVDHSYPLVLSRQGLELLFHPTCPVCSEALVWWIEVSTRG